MNDGGPAFPQTEDSWLRGATAQHDVPVPSGMSLRDWFAGKALGTLGFLHKLESEKPLDQCDVEAVCRRIASLAYQQADAMLQEKREANMTNQEVGQSKEEAARKAAVAVRAAATARAVLATARAAGGDCAGGG